MKKNLKLFYSGNVKTLLFDLDETLIHTCVPEEDDPQYKIRSLTEEDELTIVIFFISYIINYLKFIVGYQCKTLLCPSPAYFE